MTKLILQDLIKSTPISNILDAYDALFPVKNERCFVDEKNNTPENRQKVKIKRRKQIIKTLTEMSHIEPIVDPENILVVIKMIDELEPNEPFDIMDAFQCNKNTISKDQEECERFSIDFCDWAKILGSEVCKESIEEYGAAPVIVSIFFEMTFIGWTKAEADKEIENLQKLCDETNEDLENGSSEKFISAEQLFEELGYHDDRTEEEKLAEAKRMEEIAQINRKTFKDFLSKIKV